MAFSFGGAALAASRGVTGYGRGKLLASQYIAEQRAREQARREGYQQRLHEIALAHSLTNARSAATQHDPDVAAWLSSHDRPDLAPLPQSAALSLYAAGAGQAATAGRQQTTISEERHRQQYARALEFAKGFVQEHVKPGGTPNIDASYVHRFTAQAFPNLSDAELSEIARTALYSYKRPPAPRTGLAAELMAPDLPAPPP
jgi:hypothetical protein